MQVYCWIILQQQCRNQWYQELFWQEDLGTKWEGDAEPPWGRRAHAATAVPPIND